MIEVDLQGVDERGVDFLKKVYCKCNIFLLLSYRIYILANGFLTSLCSYKN